MQILCLLVSPYLLLYHSLAVVSYLTNHLIIDMICNILLQCVCFGSNGEVLSPDESHCLQTDRWQDLRFRRNEILWVLQATKKYRWAIQFLSTMWSRIWLQLTRFIWPRCNTGFIYLFSILFVQSPISSLAKYKLIWTRKFLDSPHFSFWYFMVPS